MRNRLAVVVAVLLGASTAWAISTALDTRWSPFLFKNTVTVDSRGGLVVGGSGTAITSSNAGTLVYDFPSLTGSTGTDSATVCALSGPVTVSAAFGDTCELGVDQAPVNGFGTLTAYVTAANTAKVQACATGITDGGSFNMPDASYTVRCFSQISP